MRSLMRSDSQLGAMLEMMVRNSRPIWTIRGDVLPAREKFNVQVGEFVYDRQEMFCASCHAVKRGDDNHAELPLPSILQHQVETGTTSFASRNADVGVLTDDL